MTMGAEDSDTSLAVYTSTSNHDRRNQQVYWASFPKEDCIVCMQCFEKGMYQGVIYSRIQRAHWTILYVAACSGAHLYFYTTQNGERRSYRGRRHDRKKLSLPDISKVPDIFNSNFAIRATKICRILNRSPYCL